MGKIPWIPLKKMEHGAGAKFHGFQWGNSHAFHASMEQENCNSIPHESMESMESMEYKTMENHGKHGKHRI